MVGILDIPLRANNILPGDRPFDATLPQIPQSHGGIFGSIFSDDPGAMAQGAVFSGFGAGPLTGSQKTALLFAGLRDVANNFGGAPSNYLGEQGQQFAQQNLLSRRQAVNQKIQAAYASGDMNAVRQAVVEAAMVDPDAAGHITQALQIGQPKYQAVGHDLYQIPTFGDGGPPLAVYGPKEPPKSRSIQRGLNNVEQQFNDKSGLWEDIPGAAGPKFKPEDSGDPPDQATVHYYGQSVAAGQPLPVLGMGKDASAWRRAILKDAAGINIGQGLTGVDQNVAIANTKANSGALSKQTQLRSATEGFENTMLQNMNVARALLKKGAGSTGIPVLNRYQQYLKGQYAGDPDVIALKNAIDTVADENAKIRSGTLGNTPATDAMRASIHEGLNTSQTPEQILSAFSVMEKDAGNRSRALRAQEDAIRRGLRGGSDLPQIPGIREPQASSLPRTQPQGFDQTATNPTTGQKIFHIPGKGWVDNGGRAIQ